MTRSTMLAMTLFGLVCTIDSRAEVRAITDRNGDYRGTRIVGGVRNGIWSPSTRVRAKAILNPGGDLNGDRWPAIAESNIKPHFPYVVWSRRNGSRFDLAWSRWEGDRWRQISWLDPQSHEGGDNLDAHLTFGPGARPYVVWWRQNGQQGQVFLSIYLKSQWMAPFPLTDGSVDSRYPHVEVSSKGDILVRYHTPAGDVQQEVFFDSPVTITDDVNPLDCVRAGAVIAVSAPSN
jgi:hypothetical protein